MDQDLTHLDAAATLAAASGSVRARRLDEIREWELIAHWAALHGDDPTQGPDGRAARRTGNVLVQVGGEGTPTVQDFSLGEIALARSAGVVATRNTMADVLDLQHRLPRVWRRCRAGEAEPWIAGKVARMSRHLPADRVHVVDTAVARVIDRESAQRVLSVAEAKVIEADPALHDERVEAERRRRYVGLSRTDEYGLRTLIARIESADAAWIDATVARVADILATRHDDLTRDELRAEALGYLARPAELFRLLLEADEPDEDPEPHRALAFPADLLDALRHLDPKRLAPKSVLYVHLHEAALTGASGAARVEGLGPRTLTGLQGLLGRTDVVVRPVLDLAQRVRTTAYEHPESLKEQVHLVTGGDYWPFAPSTSRHVDYDHPTPFREPEPTDTGPPSQTGTHNSGPLGRRHHRWKTHAGYRSRQSGDGRYAWLTPHGLGFLVDHTGTRRIDPEHARMIIDAPAGLDLYPAEV